MSPIYEYVCPTCKRRLEEIIMPYRNIPLFVSCPCGGDAGKVISAPSLHAVGFHFYKEGDFGKGAR